MAIAVWRVSPVAAIGLVAASHLALLYPTLRPLSQALGPVVTHFEPEGKQLWLTIDDGPDAEDTPAILELLAKHRARATFFVRGVYAAERCDLVRSIVAGRHTVENHSWSHPAVWFWAYRPSAIEREIDACSEEIEKTTGERPKLFRAPAGLKNLFVHPILKERAMPLVGWTARGFDGVDRFDVGRSLERIMRDVQPGAIILLHEGKRGARGERLNVELITLLLARLEAEGYHCVIPSPDRLRTGARRGGSE